MTKRREFYFKDGVRFTTCSACKKFKDQHSFSEAKKHWDKLAATCKECQKDKRDAHAEHYKEYRKRKRDQRSENHKKWYRANTQYAKDYVTDWRKKNKEHMRNYRSNPRMLKYRREWARNKYKHDTHYRIAACLRSRLYEALTSQDVTADDNVLEKYLGCTIAQLHCHIEKQFDEHMNWNNEGKWHIDHRIPVKAFDFKYMYQRCACFNYRNLQPMWAERNLKKRDRYDPKDKAEYMRAWRELVLL